MKPYYQDDYATIYHGDCRELLPYMPKVDLVLTDPPYPKLAGGHKRNCPGGVSPRRRVTESMGTPWPIGLQEWMPFAWEATRHGFVCFCSYHSVDLIPAYLPGSRRVALAVWYKRNATPTGSNLPRYTGEFIWLLSKNAGLNWDALDTTVFDVPGLQGGCMATERILNIDGTVAHPTQKPIGLILRLLVIGGDTILDPFMGSGTTLRAAKDLRRKAIGIEIGEKYCEIVAKRLAQEVLPL